VLKSYWICREEYSKGSWEKTTSRAARWLRETEARISKEELPTSGAIAGRNSETNLNEKRKRIIEGALESPRGSERKIQGRKSLNRWKSLGSMKRDSASEKETGKARGNLKRCPDEKRRKKKRTVEDLPKGRKNNRPSTVGAGKKSLDKDAREKSSEREAFKKEEM